MRVNSYLEAFTLVRGKGYNQLWTRALERKFLKKKYFFWIMNVANTTEILKNFSLFVYYKKDHWAWVRKYCVKCLTEIGASTINNTAPTPVHLYEQWSFRFDNTQSGATKGSFISPITLSALPTVKLGRNWTRTQPIYRIMNTYEHINITLWVYESWAKHWNQQPE